MNVLVLNAGSSSLKFQLIATDRDAIAANKDVRLCRGQIDRFGGEVLIVVLVRDGSRKKFSVSTRDMQASLEHLMRWITSRSEEHTSELQSLTNLVCRLLLEKKNEI